MAKPATPLKTFVKDGKERVAYSAADAVALRFDGWTEQAEPASAPASKPTPTKTDSGSQSR